LIADGLYGATTDPLLIEAWWKKWPLANVAIRTGAESGVVGIDIDDLAIAKPALQKLCPRYDFKSVPVQKTGKGWHLVFRHPGGQIKTVTKFLPGIDCRGDGGYIMAAPSMHVYGTRYEWKYLPPTNDRFPVLPPELLLAINGPQSNNNGPKPHFDSSIVWEGIPQGQRDDQLFRYACKMRHNDTPRDLAERLILEAAKRCGPPFFDQEALRKIEQAYKYPAGQLPDFQFVSAPKETNRAETKFQLQTWAEFLATDHGSALCTVDGIAPNDGLVAFHGRGKGGKTTFLIHAARSIASGETFLERATVKKPVVYLNYEMGFSYLKDLLRAGGPCPKDAYILNRPEPVLQTSTVEALMLDIGKAGVLLIDSFRGAFRLAGDAENSAGGAGVILRKLQDLAVRHKWLVIVVHHSNRSQREGTDGVSGTSDWIAAPDVIWTWSRPDKKKPGVLHIEGRISPVDPLAIDLAPEKCVFLGSVEESQKETDNQAILKAVTEEGQSADVIAETIGRPAGTVRKRCEDLFEAHELNRTGEGKRGDPHLYSKVCFRTPKPLGAETNSDGWSRLPR
jgi:hypothetical protein